MQIIGVDLHIRQQTIAMLDTETGELVEKTLEHDGDEVRKFYSALTGPVQVGLEASGSMHWFLELMEELGIISGCVSGRECRTRCKPWRSVTVCGEARSCGAKQANTPLHPCRCRRIPPIDAANCKTGMTCCRDRSMSWTNV
jgi:hypothetical protein